MPVELLIRLERSVILGTLKSTVLCHEPNTALILELTTTSSHVPYISTLVSLPSCSNAVPTPPEAP